MFSIFEQIKFWPRGLLAIGASLLAGYVFFSPVNVPLYNLVMFPCPDPRTPAMAEQFAQLRTYGARERDVEFRSANGRLIRGWFIELPNTRRVFLVSHGKGRNIYGKLHHAPLLLLCGGSVLMYDYQGFGASEGKISIDGACDDGVAAYDFLIEREHRKPRDIIAFGESFGCGVSAQLCAKRPLGGVILQSGFTSLMRAGRDKLPWLRLYPDWNFPKPLLMDNVSVFRQAHPPLLIIHGKRDFNLPYANATDMYSRAIEPKSLYTVPDGGHCCFGSIDQFVGTVKTFLRQNHI